MTTQQEQKYIDTIISLETQNATLLAENIKIVREQEEFQNALINKIKEIRKLGPFKRWLAYGRLLWDLIATIEKGISANK